MADIVANTPNVKQAAPPMRMADSLADLFELPSYSIRRPATNRVVDRITSKNVDILLTGIFLKVSILVAARREPGKRKTAFIPSGGILLAKKRSRTAQAQEGFSFGDFPEDWARVDPLQLCSADTSWDGGFSSGDRQRFDFDYLAASSRLTDKLISRGHEKPSVRLAWVGKTIPDSA